MQLAGSFARRDLRVLVVDADPQGTATRWAASASDEKPFPCPVIGLANAGGKVHREVAKFVEGYDLILIDCPPAADSPVPQSALLVSDLALVPLVPSPLDLWASVGIREVIHRMSDINATLAARLLLNQAQPNQNLTRETLEILPEFGIELCQSQWRQRTAFRQSAVWGQTVHDLDNKAAVTEVEELSSELLQLLELM
jgi:chromosome partitioning protein